MLPERGSPAVNPGRWERVRVNPQAARDGGAGAQALGVGAGSTSGHGSDTLEQRRE